MNTAEFPDATFKLTKPIELTSIPTDLVKIETTATGDLTLRGVTKTVTFDITARRNGESIEVNGSIPITWSDYDIPAPSGGPAQVEDSGEMEFLITFAARPDPPQPRVLASARHPYGSSATPKRG